MAAHSSDVLTDVVAELCSAENGLRRPTPAAPRRPSLPSKDIVVDIIESLRSVVFPGYFDDADLPAESIHFHVGAVLSRVRPILREQVQRALCFVCREDDPLRCPECENRAETVTTTFLSRLPAVRRLLSTDVQAAYEGDPAATSPEETILCYPGILAVTHHRLAHELYRLSVPLLPRMISEHAHTLTGIDIHPGATIGERFFIDHGTGVVIGETAVIGNGVRIYQGVTLGARSFPLDEPGHPIKGVPRHPIVEDDVIIYGGATILGRITIGRGSVIGGNVWLTHSVPPGSKISQAAVRKYELFADGEGI